MRPIRCLLVDDHAISRGPIKALLQRHAFEVVGEAPSGWRAIELIRRTTPDLVFLDLEMPDMHGIELLARIRELRPEARVVVVSGTLDDAQREACLALGAVDFVSKPWTVNRLVQAMGEALRPGRPESATPTGAKRHA